jgi:hypothetical protein
MRAKRTIPEGNTRGRALRLDAPALFPMAGMDPILIVFP